MNRVFVEMMKKDAPGAGKCEQTHKERKAQASMDSIKVYTLGGKVEVEQPGEKRVYGEERQQGLKATS